MRYELDVEALPLEVGDHPVDSDRAAVHLVVLAVAGEAQRRRPPVAGTGKSGRSKAQPSAVRASEAAS